MQTAALLDDREGDEPGYLVLRDIRELSRQHRDDQVRRYLLAGRLCHGDDHQGPGGGFEINRHQALPIPRVAYLDHGLSASDLDMDQIARGE